MPSISSRQLGIAVAAARAVGEVLDFGRWNRLAGHGFEVALDQPVVVQMVQAADHGLPPRSARSFRAARNRCTRTVDSFNPVIALTSRGVQSP